MNAYYQDPETWVAYSNYKSNFYGYGRSRKLNFESDYINSNGKRLTISFLGAVRTWKVQLITQIPASYHKTNHG
jgi:hypothetical protein